MVSGCTKKGSPPKEGSLKNEQPQKAGLSESAFVPSPATSACGSGSPRSSLRTTSARIVHDVILAVAAFLPLPFERDEHVRSLPDVFRDKSRQFCPENRDSMPFGLRHPFVLGIFPGALGSDDSTVNLEPLLRD